MFNSSTLIFLIIISFILVSFIFIKLTKFSNKIEEQDLKNINLYLDKKLILKLLTISMSNEPGQILENIMDEILHYFCLDVIAFKIENIRKIEIFKNNNISRLYKDKDKDKDIHLLLENAQNMNNEVENAPVKVQDQRQLIVFKHNEFCMLAVVEVGHSLSITEKETLGNEIITIIKLALFIQKELYTNSHS